ncbi:MAG: hypothetical protein HC775_03850 [Hyellaceae cyanobacterium CSU_1_1]|nr:hypothetical protein [Hyellaceae cyanobacterium CSU_1_1]
MKIKTLAVPAFVAMSLLFTACAGDQVETPDADGAAGQVQEGASDAGDAVQEGASDHWRCCTRRCLADAGDANARRCF